MGDRGLPARLPPARAALLAAGERSSWSRRSAGHKCAGVPGIPLASWIDHPLTGGRYSFGGTLATNARVRIDSWPRVIAFLREALAAAASDGGCR